MSYLIMHGDARALPLREASVHCVVTSPPYYGLRDYGVAGQLGHERTLDEYVSQLVQVFRDVRRVLRPDGVCFLNLGDSYASSGMRNGMTGGLTEKQLTNAGSFMSTQSTPVSWPGLKPKDLCGVPWRVAFALQADGWWLRSDIIWWKPNPMPESVTDRPTRAHEYIFLLTKSERYYWEQEALREPHQEASLTRVKTGWAGDRQRNYPGAPQTVKMGDYQQMCHPHGRNARSVWSIATEPFPGSHFAVMPTELVKRCILAGTSEKGACAACGAPWVRAVKHSPGLHRNRNVEEGYPAHFAGQGARSLSGARHAEWKARHPDKLLGWQPTCSCNALPVPCVVLDPFSGSGTVPLVADRLGRHGHGLDLSRPYCEMAQERLADETPLFAAVPISPAPVAVQADLWSNNKE